MAAAAPGQFTLAPHHESATAAFVQDLHGRESEIKFEHSRVAWSAGSGVLS
jgi:hypothetical protein